MRAPLEPAFLALAPGDGNQRFTIFHPPGREPLLGRVVQVHAFGEEMNKSRRMVAQQARALARAGFAVFQIDLFGCGDSAGDFGEATWQRWLDDVVWAARHLRQRMAQASVSVPPTPLWLWGHRAGALLAVEAAVRLGEEEPCHLLLWQPTLAGRSTVQQFLRLKMAAGLARAGGGRLF